MRRLLFRESRRILEEVLIYEVGPIGQCAGCRWKCVMGAVDTVEAQQLVMLPMRATELFDSHAAAAGTETISVGWTLM